MGISSKFLKFVQEFNFSCYLQHLTIECNYVLGFSQHLIVECNYVLGFSQHLIIECNYYVLGFFQLTKKFMDGCDFFKLNILLTKWPKLDEDR